VTLTIACSVPPPEPQQVYDNVTGEYRWVQGEPAPLEQAPLIASGLSLLRADGSNVRFSDEHAVRPDLEAATKPGDYFLTIRYQPQKPPDIIGRPVTVADGFVAIETRLGSVLAHQGLVCDRLRSLAFEVNGHEIASAGDLPLPTGGGRVDLPASFQTASTSLGESIEASPAN
jgi:hypothetical protein